MLTMMVDITNIVHLVTELQQSSASTLRQLVLEAYDLYQLWGIVCKNSDLRNKLINLLDAPSSILNEKIQVRHDILKRFTSFILSDTSDFTQSSVIAHTTQICNNEVKYIVIDNTITAIRRMLSIIQQNVSVQIVVSGHKVKNLIESIMGIKCPSTDNEIIKILNTITFENANSPVVDISHIRNNCDYTFFFDINPDITWTNNIGHLWLSGRERELLGLTTQVNWQRLLHISPNVYIFSREVDMPQWQHVQHGSIEKIRPEYPQIRIYSEDVIATEINDINDITINATGVSELIYNPYLLYLKSILQLTPKKTYTNDIGKIYNTFYKILHTDTITPILDELKEIDYFYYKKIQAFVEMIPQWKYSPKSTNVGDITVVYSDKPYKYVTNTVEIDYYTLNASISTRDVIQGDKSGLMLQALSASNDARFNIISPDWHSSSSINKKTIEVSKDIIQEYRERIISAWDSFKRTNMLELKFDIGKTSASYKHLERVQ